MRPAATPAALSNNQCHATATVCLTVIKLMNNELKTTTRRCCLGWEKFDPVISDPNLVEIKQISRSNINYDFLQLIPTP